MNVDVRIVKGIPLEQIETFEDKTVYNCALLTRETAKNLRAFPYLTGELERQEISAPITGSKKTYGLSAGVDYAMYVWKMNNVNWTNPNTQAQWYYSVYNKEGASITTDAVVRAIKEL